MNSRAPSSSRADPMVVLAREWGTALGLSHLHAADLPEIWDTAQVAGVDSPGLAFARWFAPNAVGGALVPVLANAPSAEGLLDRLARFHPLFGAEALTFSRANGQGVLCLTGRSGEPAHPESAAACFAMVVATLTRLGTDPSAIYVTLRRPAPSARDEFARAFVHVRFGGDTDQIAVPAATLGTEFPHGDTAVLDLLDSFAEEQLRRRRTGWAAQVDDVLDSADATDLTAVAARLAVSTRALQEHLRSEGTTFSGLVDARRRHLALALLSSTDLSATQVAGRVGFGSLGALHRAVRRWTGLSPTAYRASRRPAQ
ncbi:MAG: helix-turn-helix domain-containing protein [Nocardioides sp.]